MSIEHTRPPHGGHGERGITVLLRRMHDVVALERAINTTNHDSKPLFVLGYTDTAAGVPQLDARKPNLHYVRFKDSDEVAQMRTLLADWNRQAT